MRIFAKAEDFRQTGHGKPVHEFLLLKPQVPDQYEMPVPTDGGHCFGYTYPISLYRALMERLVGLYVTYLQMSTWEANIELIRNIANVILFVPRFAAALAAMSAPLHCCHSMDNHA